MFDNPKKELERLEQQLLAAETEQMEDDEFDRLYEDIYEEFGKEEPYELDDELLGMLNRTPIYDSNDFEETDCGAYDEMAEDRYVAAPKKKSLLWLIILVILETICVIALAVWWLVRSL